MWNIFSAAANSTQPLMSRVSRVNTLACTRTRHTPATKSCSACYERHMHIHRHAVILEEEPGIFRSRFYSHYSVYSDYGSYYCNNHFCCGDMATAESRKAITVYAMQTSWSFPNENLQLKVSTEISSVQLNFIYIAPNYSRSFLIKSRSRPYSLYYYLQRQSMPTNQTFGSI